MKLIDKAKLSEMLGMKPGTLVKMAQAGRIPHYKLNHKTLRFEVGEIQRWAERRKIEPVGRRNQ